MFKWLGQRSEKKQQIRQLWERGFNIVKEGLDEGQVVAFVDNLIAQHKASQQASSDSLRSLLKTAVTDAEQMAASIKMKAQTEGEAEAAIIIAQAKEDAREIERRAEIATQKEAEDILSVANRKAEITEVEAKQKALLFLLRAREEIEKEVKNEYKRAYARLSSSLQDLVSEGQSIEVELKGKRASLWEGKDFELKEHEAVLLKTSEAAVPSLETPAPTEAEVEPDIASKEKIEEPTQLQEDVPEEKVEEPVQLQKDVPEEKVEEPTQLQKDVPEEKVKEPTQLQKDVPEEKVEEPTQLQEEVTVSESAEETTEELLGQHLPEKRPGRRQADSAQLKQDSQALYAGEVELAVAIPVDLKVMSKLYNHLQTMPELRILHTRGSWDRGTIITVVLDKPIPLMSMISKIPGVEVTPELLQKDDLVKGIPSSLLKEGKKGVKRVKLTLKEVQSP